MEGYIGEIRMVAYNWAPINWALCDGNILNVKDYPALFSILTDKYGGNGTTTFALPDFRGRTPIQQTNILNLGQHAGAATVALNNISQIPPHTHKVENKLKATIQPYCNDSNAGNVESPANNFPSVTNKNVYDSSYDHRMASSYVGLGSSISMKPAGATGYVNPHDNVQPYTVMNYIICLDGDYPSKG